VKAAPPPAHPELGRWVAAVLRVGTLAAIAMVAIGYAWAVATGERHLEAAPVVDEIAAGGGDGLAAVGLLTLTLVPPAMLVVAAVAHAARARERRMAIAAVVVAALLVGSLAVAAVLGSAI
jgi:hypothetical protein